MPPPLRAAAALGIAYRPMSDADLPFVEALFASTRVEELAITGWPPEMIKAFLSQQHRAQHHHYRTFHPDAEWLIIERGGTPMGRLYVDEANGKARIIDISLLPEVRGQGFGQAILTDIIDAAAEAGKNVTLHVEMRNPARRLYERLGFTLVRDTGLYLEMERYFAGKR